MLLARIMLGDTIDVPFLLYMPVLDEIAERAQHRRTRHANRIRNLFRGHWRAA